MSALTVACVLPVGAPSPMLDECLATLRCQTHPELEVIVVDDSKDGLLAAADGVRLLRSGGRGPYVARNVGWRATDADVVLFLDVRSRPVPEWAQRMVAAFTDPAVALVGSEVRVRGGASLAAGAAELGQPFALGKYLSPPFFRPYLPTCNLGVRRKDLEAVGGFGDARSGGDADLCWRVLGAAGRELAPIPERLMDWVPRDGLRDFLSQHFRYGRSNYELRLRWQAEGAPQLDALSWPALLRRALRVTRRALRAAIQRRRSDLVQHVADAAWLSFQMGYRAALGRR